MLLVIFLGFDLHVCTYTSSLAKIECQTVLGLMIYEKGISTRKNGANKFNDDILL